MFSVRYAAGSNTYYVADGFGHLAAHHIPTYAAAEQTAAALNEDGRDGAGFVDWHRKVSERGPTTVQRPMHCKPPGLTWERPSQKYASDPTDTSGLSIVRR